jgi:polysaccharide pyruvyl transferase WcaK-like protein
VLARVFDDLASRCQAQPVFFVTQAMDLTITRAVQRAMTRNQSAPVIAVSSDCDYREITALLARMDMLIAMRTHALILGTSVFTPCVNLNTYPKSIAYMETIGQAARGLPIEQFSYETLSAVAQKAWTERRHIRAELQSLVPGEKEKARSSAYLLRDALQEIRRARQRAPVRSISPSQPA